MKGKVISFAHELLKRGAKTTPELRNGEERRDTMKKAIAYTSDIILGRTGEVISREYQKELISKFAEEKGLEIVAWFEDEVYEEDTLVARPGIQKMLAYDGPCDVFLVERVWALSRKMATLTGFFKVLAQKKLVLETATYLWDCTSQMVRRAVTTKPVAPAVVKPLVTKEDAKKAVISRPEKLNFGWAFHRQGA